MMKNICRPQLSLNILWLVILTVLLFISQGTASASWTIETVDDNREFTGPSKQSLAFDSNDNPHYVNKGDHLYHAFRENDIWQYKIIDPSSAASYISMTIDSTDNVHVSYYDSVNEDLVYATNMTGQWVRFIIDSSGDVGEDSSIAVDASGMVHISYTDSTNNAVKYARKEFGTWTTRTVETPGSVYDTSIAADSSGNAHIAYTSASSVKYAVYVSGSITVQLIDTATGSGIAIAIDSSNIAHVIYSNTVYVNGDESTTLKYATNPSGGWTIGDLYTITDIGTSIRNLSISADPSDNIHISFYSNIVCCYAEMWSYAINYLTDPAAGGINHTIASSGGAIWQNVSSVSSPSMALDSTGNPHILYYNSGGYSAPSLRLYDHASTTTESIASSQITAEYSDIAIDMAGNMHISYFDGTNEDLKYATNSSGSWDTQFIDSTGDLGEYSSIAIDSAGNVHISYYDDTNNALKYATNSSGSWTSQTIDSAGDVGRYTSIAIGSSDSVHISYYDTTNNALKYATNSSGSWNTQTLISTGGSYTSIAIDSAGKVHISCHDGYFDLKYSTNSSGSWNTQTIDNTGNAGKYSSIAIDPAGNAHISYYKDHIPEDLYYATNSSGSWNTQIIDSGQNSGMYSSLALDSSGYVHISYYNETFRDLRYATNSSGSWATQTIESTGTVGKYTSIAIDPSDNVHISYTESYDLKYATTATVSPCTDNDGDGYGNAASGTDSCIYGEADTDCDDNNSAVNPGVSEITGNCVDDDCSAATYDSPAPDWFLECVDSITYDSSTAVDSNNNLHISYYYGGNLMYATNASGQWATETLDDSASVTGWTSIALDSEGSLHINYYDSTNTELRYMTNASGAWASEVIDTTDNVGIQSAIALDASDNVHIGYYDSTNKDLKYATNASGAWVIETIDSVGSVGYHLSMTMDSAGTLHISYQDNTDDGSSNDLKYATNSSGSWVTEQISDDGHRPAITTDPADNVYISYYKVSSEDLVVVSNSSGVWVTETVDAAGDVGNFSLIVADSAGYLHISYINNTNDDLMYATNISDSWVTVTLDDNGSFGFPTSLTVDSDDNVHISYRDVSIGYLKYITSAAHVSCTDSDGDGYGTGAAGAEVCRDDRADADCDDNSAVYNPATNWHEDSDSDGYGNPSSSLQQCLQPANYVLDNSDCDDSSAAINPLTYWYPDSDGDGFGNPAVSFQQCTQYLDHILDGTDCNDNDLNIYPGGPPVRIIDSPYLYYAGIQAAYDEAVEGDIIQSQYTTLNGTIYLDRDVAVTLDGGYNCGYTSNTGTTVINGYIDISNGVVTIGNITIP